MEIAMKRNKTAQFTAMQDDQQNVREMVENSYQDMLDGKGRGYTEFFAEMESRYKRVKL